MKELTLKRMLFGFGAATILGLVAQPLQAELLEKTKKVGKTTVEYKVVLPNGYDAAKAYPAILAFGGGPQDMNTVNAVLNRNFRVEAEKRGYIVIAPAAPDDDLFFEDGARIFPEFLKMMLADYKIRTTNFISRDRRMAALPHSTLRRPILNISCPSPHFRDTCGTPRRPNFRPFRKCASSCTSAKTILTGGTAK